MVMTSVTVCSWYPSRSPCPSLVIGRPHLLLFLTNRDFPLPRGKALCFALFFFFILHGVVIWDLWRRHGLLQWWWTIPKDVGEVTPFFVCPLLKDPDVISCLAEVQAGLTESRKGHHGNLALGLMCVCGRRGDNQCPQTRRGRTLYVSSRQSSKRII